MSLFCEREDVLRFFLEGTRHDLQEASPYEIAEITVHPGAVAGVAKVGQVIDGHHTELAYVGERLDFRGPERIGSVAVGISCGGG